MNRQDKLKLLKGLSTGSVQLDTLKDKDLCIHIGMAPPEGRGTAHYVDGKEVSEATYLLEYEHRLKQLKARGEAPKINVNII